MYSHVELEIASQPECWRQAVAVAHEVEARLPQRGQRAAIIGCGTSLFMAQAYASLREHAGLGETDAFPASEFPDSRRYDRVVALSRSGTTTEVLDALKRVRYGSKVAITASPTSPIIGAVDDVIVLDFADESSIVQTRFATSALALLRTHVGQDLMPVISAAGDALGTPLGEGITDADQFTFLGRGWTIGIALEAGLKLREAAGAWAEAYPAMEYRHGPISVARPNRIVWVFGPCSPGLAADVRRTGATLVTSSEDAQAELVRAQRLAVVLAKSAGLDPDRPRHLTRSVILG